MRGVMEAHPDSYFPEPFVWFFFETLVTAGLLMERGDVEQRDTKFWRSLILHRDVKLDNSKAFLLREFSDTNLSSQYFLVSIPRTASKATICPSLVTLASV